MNGDRKFPTTLYSRDRILRELFKVSTCLRPDGGTEETKPFAGEVTNLLDDADRLLDLYIDMGYMTTAPLVLVEHIPEQGEYSPGNDWEH